MSTDKSVLEGKTRQYGVLGLLLTAQQRRDFARLHGFLHMAHGYANKTPRRPGSLNDLIAAWQRVGDRPMRELEAAANDGPHVRASKDVARLKIIYGFDIAWVDAFLVAMLMDIKPRAFKTFAQSQEYIHGSAEVAGLMAASLLRLPKEAQSAAALQARAIQWLYFVRNLAGDATRKRNYFPQEDMARFGLKDVSEATVRNQPAEFAAFVRFQLARYQDWQHEALQGLLPHLPRRERAALHAIADANARIARMITKDPSIIFSRPVRISQARLIMSAAGHLFD